MNSLFGTGRLVALAICALSSATVAQELPRVLTGQTITEVLPPHTTGPLPDWNDEPWPSEEIGTAHGSRVTPGTLDRLHAGILRSDLEINGAQSCAAASCHGGPRPGVSQPQVRRGSEYQLWFENDPHARSWQTLCSDESLRMLRQLKIIKTGQIVDQAAYDNCLACHNSTNRFDSAGDITSSGVDTPSQSHAQTLNSFIREGVGCSSCHGPDERWRGTHYQYDWSPQAASNDGFVAADDLYVRARMCASCHVGDKDRDMNHDIIAAGHPPLRYELATYHAWLPKHWRDDEAADRTSYEAQLWLAGQVAATDATLSLLQARAQKSHSVSQWPELSAYDCASCHQSLGLDTDRDSRSPSRKSIASYSQWNDTGLRWLITYRTQTNEATDDDFSLLSALNAVRRTMDSKPIPDATAVAQETSHARLMLARWYDGTPGLHERQHLRSDRLGQIVASVAGKRETFRTWESASQFYLAAIAARESWPGGPHGAVRNSAIQLRNELRYDWTKDSSRYGKPSLSGPSISSVNASQVGAELASTLGPISLEPLLDEDVQPTPEELRKQMKQMIEEINRRWQDSEE